MKVMTKVCRNAWIESFLLVQRIQNGFVWDDEVYIEGNKYITDLSGNGIKAIFSNTSSDNYAPVTDLVNSLIYKLGGLDSSAFHFGSLLNTESLPL